MKMVNQKSVRQVFKDHDIQLGSGTMEMIDREVYRQIVLMAKRCRAGNVRRLMTDLFWIALGKLNLDR